MTEAAGLDGAHGLFDQDLDDRILKSACHVGACLGIEFGGLLAGKVAAHRRQHGGFEAAETEIEIAGVEHRAWQLESIRAALCRQFGKHRTAGVGQAEQLGGLVKSLAGSVVERFTEQGVVTDAVDAHQLAVAARNEQRDEGKARWAAREQWREQVPLEVVHRHAGDVEGGGQAFGEGGADE